MLLEALDVVIALPECRTAPCDRESVLDVSFELVKPDQVMERRDSCPEGPVLPAHLEDSRLGLYERDIQEAKPFKLSQDFWLLPKLTPQDLVRLEKREVVVGRRPWQFKHLVDSTKNVSCSRMPWLIKGAPRRSR